MKWPFKRDVPPRAAAVVVALALVASIVTGRERHSSDAQPVQAPTPSTAAGGAMPEKESRVSDLDLDKLNRPPRDEKIANLFGSRAFAAPPPPAVVDVKQAPPPPPPAPTAPPLPFRYFGKMVDGDRTVVFLMKNDETFSGSTGEALDNDYRIESITESAINFIYLPLGSKQTLPITNPD